MRFLAGFFALFFFCSGAQADNALVRGVLGVDLGFASGFYDYKGDPFLNYEDVKGVSLVYGFRGGLRIGDYFGIDVGIQDLGTFDDKTLGGESSISTDMSTVSLLGLIPMSEDASILLRLGRARWDMTEKYTQSFLDLSFKDDDSGSDIYFGFGLEAALAENFVLGAELQVFQMEPVLFSNQFQLESEVTYAVTRASLMYRF